MIKALLKRETMISGGLIYLAVGVGILWIYIFTFTALSTARTKFEVARAEHAKLTAMREIAEKMAGSTSTLTGTNLSLPEVVKSLLRGAGSSIVNRELQALLSSAAAFDEIERVTYARYTNSVASDTTGNVIILARSQLPTHLLFLTYLEFQHEDLFDSSIVQWQLKYSVSKLNLRSFIFLSLGFGLVFGGYNLLKLSARDEKFRREKHYLWPLATPVLAVVAILGLTGFGPVFSEAVDVSTAKFLMIMCLIIAINPEHFLFTLRRWASEVWTGFSGAPSQFQTEAE